MTESLSPAANAVLDAFLNGFVCRQSCNVAFEADRNGLAAALRAAVDQAHPKAHIEDINYVHQNYVDGWKDALDVILAIADELEAQ